MADIQQTHILNLPPHVLTEIFDSVADKDLIRLTKVCRYFNDIISNNAKFLVKMPVDLSQFTLRKQWIGSRKYNNIVITMDKFEDFLPLMESLAENIVKFKFSQNKVRRKRMRREVTTAFDTDKLVELLEKMPKLKYLDISLPNDAKENLFKNEAKLKLNLEKLEANMNSDLLALFFDCNVKRFYGCGWDSIWINSTSNSNAFVKFLKNQKELQELGFKPSGRRNVLQDESLMNVDFKLKKLQLHTGYRDNIDDVIKFLLQFKDSLESLFLERHDEGILRALLNFEKLKVLEFYKYATLRQLPDIALINIERVTIFNTIPPNFPAVFLNLRHLTIGRLRDTNIANIIEQLINLESIIVWHSNIVIPRTTAKTLTLKYRQAPFPRPFDYDNHNFEEIYVTKRFAYRPRWLKEFIDGGYAANLKIFEVTTRNDAEFLEFL